MKLSYTIRGWKGRDWPQLCAAAVDTRLQGLEIDSVENPIMQQRMSPINPELAAAAHRRLAEQGLTVPCIGTARDFAAPDAADEIAGAIRAAGDLLVPYVAVASAQADVDGAIAALTPWVEEAERTGVVDDIRAAVIGGTTYYYVRLRGEQTYYSLSAAENEQAVLLNTGDTVTLLVETADAGQALQRASLAGATAAQAAQPQEADDAAPAGEA